MRTSEAEFRRVVRHEAGHTLGFEHEHMRSDIVKRIDRAKAIAYFDRTEGWTPEEVEEQVLTPAGEEVDHGHGRERSAVDHVLPAARGSIMKDGKAVKGGNDINPKDFAFAASLYPKERRDGPAKAPLVAVRELRRAARRRRRYLSHRGDGRVPAGDGRPACGPDGRPPKFAQVFASYGGARVTVGDAAARGQGRGADAVSAGSSACTSASRTTRIARTARCRATRRWSSSAGSCSRRSCRATCAASTTRRARASAGGGSTSC